MDTEYGYDAPKTAIGYAQAQRGPLSTAPRQITLAEQFSTIAGRLSGEIDRLEHAVDRILGRPSADCAANGVGSTALPETRDRLALLVDRLEKVNSQLGEVA